MNVSGIAVVARQEFTIRIRAGRWRWLLAAWFIVLLLFTLLVRASITRVAEDDVTNKGVVVYGALALLVLALALLVVPALAAQSVNGDRERGTLATLQVTRLTAGDIAVGKLAAAWGTSLVFLALTLPLVGYSMFLGGVPLARVLVVLAVITLLLGSVLSMSLCLSALLSRTTTSGVLAYLVVFALSVGTLIAFGIAAALSNEHYTQVQPAFCPSETIQPAIPVPSPVGPGDEPPGGTYVPAPVPSPYPYPGPGPSRPCEPASTYEATRTRTDRVWWLLAPNPFVILADAAPQLAPLSPAEQERRRQEAERGRSTTDLRDTDPLGTIGRSVRSLRLHPGEDSITDTSFAPLSETPAPRKPIRRPVWPYGLAFDVLLGAGALWLTARSLRTPTRNLPKGQRVA